MRQSLRLASAVLFASLAAGVAGCGDDDDVSSNEQARLAYIGLDQSVEKSLTLGFAGFNAASSANIPVQTGSGEAGGTLTITGQVDQGSSTNKGMRLRVGMVTYSDGAVQVPDDTKTVDITYTTNADPALQPELNLSLRDIPTGTFTGTLTGQFVMSGDLESSVVLNLSMTGEIESDGAGGTRRKAGTTTITGTAKSSDGTYDVNVTI